MRNHQGGRPGSRTARLLRGAERLLVTAGALMLLWSALPMLESAIAQRSARRSLEAASHPVADAFPPRAPDAAAAPLEAPVPASPRRNAAPARGAAIASLSIPRIDLSAVVLHGSDTRTLRRGPGHLEDTAVPGERGNAVIAGHRDSFFRPLRKIRVGDEVLVDTPQQRIRYRVTWVRVVSPRDLSVIEPTDDAVLTLITCYPFWVLGNAPDRFVVRAARVADPPAAALASLPAPQDEPAWQDAPAPLDESIGASPPDESESEWREAGSRPVLDDEALVRRALERFRLTYNARLVSHNDVRPGGLLEFRTCDITIAGDQAAAHCGTGSDSGDDGKLSLWTSELRRVDGKWAITSIVAD